MGNIFWGILLSSACMFLLFFLVRGFYPKYVFNIKTFVVGGVLFIFLTFQSILFTGALTIKKMSNDVGLYINDYVEAYYPVGSKITTEESQQMFDEVLKVFPLLRKYVDKGTFVGFSTGNIAEAVVGSINKYFNWYMVRRVLWSLLFVAISVFVAIKTADIDTHSSSSSRRRGNSYNYNRRSSRHDNNF